jgi:hypothetical protein
VDMVWNIFRPVTKKSKFNHFKFRL